MVQKNIPLPRLDTVDLTETDTKRSYNRDLFREVAPAYDNITNILSFGRDRTWKRKLLDRLPQDDIVSVCLDIACGTGDIAASLFKKYPSAQVVGIDQSEDMLRLAIAHCEADSRVAYIQADMDNIPLPDESVDIVTGGYALRNAPNLDKALSETARVLRPSGTAAFLDFSRPPSKVSSGFTLFTIGLWGSLWGLVFHRNADVYRYIADSLRLFPDRQTLSEKFRVHGLETTTTKYFFFGFMELRFLKKAAR
jgi:demethylmenaquinone methyltransferase/2-methoxy-6-polyprenyl-1,4-benzoquinol methylase